MKIFRSWTPGTEAESGSVDIKGPEPFDPNFTEVLVEMSSDPYDIRVTLT